MKRKTQIFVSIIAVLSVCLFILCACDTKPNKPVVENVVERNGQLVDIKQFDLDTLNCLNLDFITTHMTQFSRLILNYEDIMVAPDGAPSNYVFAINTRDEFNEIFNEELFPQPIDFNDKTAFIYMYTEQRNGCDYTLKNLIVDSNKVQIEIECNRVHVEGQLDASMPLLRIMVVVIDKLEQAEPVFDVHHTKRITFAWQQLSPWKNILGHIY